MTLRDALLCIDCEFLYSHANRCPRCGSQVCFPIARALDRPPAAVVRRANPWPRAVPARPRIELEVTRRPAQRRLA